MALKQLSKKLIGNYGDDAARLIYNYGDDLAQYAAGYGDDVVENMVKYNNNIASDIPRIYPDKFTAPIQTTNYLGTVTPNPTYDIEGVINGAELLPTAVSTMDIPNVAVPNLNTEGLVADFMEYPIDETLGIYDNSLSLRPHNNTALGRWFRQQLAKKGR
jgi:hypothetical protein